MAVRLEIIKELVESVVVTATTTADVGGVISSPGDLPMDWRIEFEERAAILEFCAGLSREVADVQALQEITGRIRRLETIF
ncbi:MAG: hypothetical protein ACYS74_03095 [Planctomycetota bacterium]|jgi:hypothetical protein